MMFLPSRRGIELLYSTARGLSGREVRFDSYSRQWIEKGWTQKKLSSKTDQPQADINPCINSEDKTQGLAADHLLSGAKDVDQRVPDQISSPEQPTQRRKRETLSLPTVFLPPELQKAVDTLLSRYPRKSLIHDGESLSEYLLTRKTLSSFVTTKRRGKVVQDVDSWEHEKSKAPFQPTLRYGRREGVAYAAGRIQATYGVTLRVLSEIAHRAESSFKPETLLDFGSGLGTTVWAAHQLWGGTIYEYQCVDSSQEMGDLARVLRTGGKDTSVEMISTHSDKEESIPGVYSKQYLPASNKVGYDIVVSGYTLGEMPSLKLKKQSLASLWRKTKQYLVLIEPGNWAGFQTILDARDTIVNQSKLWTKYEGETSEQLEGQVFAPCPHDLVCPLSPSLSEKRQRPCHFAQRVQLAFSERNGPLRHKGFHIENFCYVVLKKGQRDINSSSEGRILQPTKKRSRHVICNLCLSNGESSQVILTKGKHGEQYKKARRSEWGDLMSLNLEPKIDPTCCESE